MSDTNTNPEKTMEVRWPKVPCCMTYSDDACVCGTEERYLREVCAGEGGLTAPQREWCLSEIGRVEGWDRAEHETDSDKELARNVLSAWTDYARDKGLL